MNSAVEREKIAQPRKSIGYLAVKRGFDIICAFLALVVLSPIFIVIMVAICVDDPKGGPFFCQKRVGRGGKDFTLIKFRSMRRNSDDLESVLTKEELETYRNEFKLARDPRITRLGAVLRKSSLDELPQFINILKGDMSLVGPRPLLREELESKYAPAEIPVLVSVRPGLTGAWQVSGRNGCTYESGERQRTELRYVEERCVSEDIKIMARTVAAVFRWHETV